MDPLRLRTPHVVVVETDGPPRHRRRRSEASCRRSATSSPSTAGGLDALREKGREVPDADLAARRAGLDRGSVATIIYTSGTTGRPKGCELTHGNFLDLAENAIEKLGQVVLTDNASTLLFLPLAHVFARFIEVLCVAARARMGHSADIKTLLDDFAGFQPTFVLAVPRVFEKIYNSAEAKASAEGKGKIFLRAATVAIAYSEALDAGGPGLRAAPPARRLRPSRLRQAARRHGRSGALRRVRRRPARHPPRPLLPRHRRHHPRGLRPHRDDGSGLR